MSENNMGNDIQTGKPGSWKELTLREQVAQTVILHVSQDVLPTGDIERFIRKYPVGGIFVGGEVIEDGSNSFESVRKSVEECQKASSVPMLVSADLENGCGDVIPGLTSLPWPMALGAANDSDLARRYGQACAREGRLVGINWALAPMADLNLHPLSSNVGTRAFGDDADRIIPLLQGFVDGLQQEGMAACAKTFPGDGSDYRDQHLTTTMNQLSQDDWFASYGRVFQSLIDEGVATIMTAHISAPSFQSQREVTEDGRLLPCTVSYELTTGLLKERLGFGGLVVSDAFGMGGILSHLPVEDACVEAFKAGVDMLLWPGVEYIDRMVDLIKRGEVPRARLDDALQRIWKVKEVYAFRKETPLDRKIVTAEAEAVAHETAKSSLTLLWNRSQTLPLDITKEKRLLILAATPNIKAFQRMEVLQNELQARGFEVDLKRNVFPEELKELAKDYDRILVAVERQFHRPLGTMDLFGEDARNYWSCSCSGWDKMIAIGLGSPYLVPWYFPQVKAAINAYSSAPLVQKIVAAGLCGELDFSGVDPVRIEHRFGVKDLSDYHRDKE
ncbi:MAG: hypothetical protein JJU20_15040 [Opitutales bacterium]|nr:hypothetical protein [Opitutales bacterium]